MSVHRMSQFLDLNMYLTGLYLDILHCTGTLFLLVEGPDYLYLSAVTEVNTLAEGIG